MFKSKISKNYLIPFIALPFLGTAIYINENFSKTSFEISKQDSAVNINRDFLKLTSLGNKRFLADLMWIQTLLESDVQKYEKKDLNNWMFHRFLTIASLDPNFYENYLWGGMYLSIIKNDLEGAATIYEKGLAIYNNDYRLNYNAGFNYYFEMGEFEKGLRLLEKIENHPDSPPSLKFIIYKLRFETGKDYDAAISLIIHSIKTNKDPVLDRKLKADLYALKAEKDLECLNSNHNSCEYLDAEGTRYQKIGTKWQAAKVFKPYKLHLRK